MMRSLIFGSLAGVASALLVLTAASGPLGFLDPFTKSGQCVPFWGTNHNHLAADHRTTDPD